MNTADRQYLRELAYSMQETYQDDPEGLKTAQEDARNVVTAMQAMLPGESNDTLCCATRIVCKVVAALSKTPVALVGDQMQKMCAAYPLAAGVLAGVYALPDPVDSEGGAAAESAAKFPKTTFTDVPGMYL